MRKYYIDNIRILCILLLFPFHTAMIYNDFGERWYVHGKEMVGASLLNYATYPWWMSLLFALAGISTVYALKHRSGKEYLAERFHKLFIPLLAALLLIVPVQSYCADRFYNGYTGSYLSHFKLFFQLTDWSGSDGHFTTGHTWFILYLFIICTITLPLMLWYKKKEKKIDGSKITILKLLPFFLVIVLSTLILDIGGKSIGEFAACFLIGYFILSIDEVQERLAKYVLPLGIAWLALMLMRCTLCRMYIHGNTIFSLNMDTFGLVLDIQHRLFGWIGILACLGLGKRFLNFNSKFTQYFAPAAFPLYFFHQSVIVVVGYFLVNRFAWTPLEYFIIMIISFILTMLCYEICKRFRITRFLFGIKG